MIELTNMAKEKLRDYLKSNHLSTPLRVLLMEQGCAGPKLALAIDEKKQEDRSFHFDGLELVIAPDLMDQCETVSVDYIDEGSRSGFSISSTGKAVTGTGGCSGCNSGGCSC